MNTALTVACLVLFALLALAGFWIMVLDCRLRVVTDKSRWYFERWRQASDREACLRAELARRGEL